MIADLPACEPYLESACKIAAEKLGRSFHYIHWDKSPHTKGCWYYKYGPVTDKVYFGDGGTFEEMKIYPPPIKPAKLRPKGFDCKTGSFDRKRNIGYKTIILLTHILSRSFVFYFL